MRGTAFIVNPNAGTHKAWTRLSKRIQNLIVEPAIHLTTGVGDGVVQTRAALDEGATTIIAVGGDGTLNEVLNGVMAAGRADNVVLGIIPAGTASDFAMHWHRGGGVEAAMNALLHAKFEPVDIARVTFMADGREHYFINACSFGLSADVAHMVNSMQRMKRLSGRLTYLLAGARKLIGAPKIDVSMRAKDWSWSGDLTFGALMNGSVAGGGLRLATMANPKDGQLDLLSVGPVNMLDFIGHAPKLLFGDILTHPRIRHRATQGLSITPQNPDEDIAVECDGEDVGKLPIRVDIMPLAVKMLRMPEA